MTELFKRCVDKILNNEGGYVHDPDDPGGETNMGISKRSYPDVDIKNLTVEQAEQIYYIDFWQPHHFDEFMDNEFALQVFDMTVNSGRTGIKILQKLVGVFPDGVIGNITLRAVREKIIKDVKLTELYKLKRIEYYYELCEKKSVFRKYFYGWIHRVFITKL